MEPKLSSTQSTLLLSDGHRIPVLGIGTWLDSGEAVSLAIKHGYRLIDTASLYKYMHLYITCYMHVAKTCIYL